MHKTASKEAVTSLHDLSATDLIAGYKAKQFSPSEVLEDVITHVAAWEPHIKALYLYDPDGARKVARLSTDRWQNGEPSGALDGVPVTIKDNVATKDQPVPLGAASMPLVPAAKDAPPAARLREAGAVIFSKTTMPDYGMLSSGLSSFHPLTRNPWDLEQEPGRLERRRRRRGRGGLWPLASRHRYRRLGAAAGVLVRAGRAEAESRAHPDRSALCRPRRGSHDPHGRRRRADDERAVETGSPRRHEPAAERHPLEDAWKNRRASCGLA